MSASFSQTGLSPDAATPNVAVILVNYGAALATIACVQSLLAMTNYPSRIIVVDNASLDDSVEQLQKAFSDLPAVELILSSSNLGFSGGNNLGLKQAMADKSITHFWLLNNDTTVPADALSALLTTASSYPNALIGPVIRYPDGQFQRIGNRLCPWSGKVVDYPEVLLTEGLPVQSLSGCSLLIPRLVLDKTGLMDERFFLYFEDNAFCHQAGRVGFDCRISEKATVFHQEGHTTGTNRPLVTYYYQRNRLLQLKDQVSPWAFVCVQLYTRFRLWRSGLKASASAEKAQHHQAFQLAVQDYYQGVIGPCPHPL